MKSGKIILLIGISLIPLISCGTDFQHQESTELNTISLECLSEDQLDEIRNFPIRDTIHTSFIECKTELKEKLGNLKLSEQQIVIVFLSILSQSMAPFGTSKSIELEDLLKDKMLDCDNYALLMGYFYKILNNKPELSLRFVGFDGGAIGNHAQVFAEGKDGTILLDPTIGLVGKITFNELLKGISLNQSQFMVIRVHRDSRIDAFTKKVVNAISKGKYQPSDLLYFLPSTEEFIAFSKEVAPLWEEKNYPLLIRRYPTPGSIALKKNLLKK